MSSAVDKHAKLSWSLIEYKVMYYRPDKVHRSRHEGLTVSDDLYDRLELRYLELCRELGKPNTIVHKSYPGFEDLEGGMLEIDEDRPSVQLVLKKLGTKLKTSEPWL